MSQPSPNNDHRAYRRRRSALTYSRQRALADWYGRSRGELEHERMQDESQHTSEVVDVVLRKFDSPENILLRRLMDQWEELVSEHVSRVAQPRRIMGKTLLVEVCDPAWQFQLSHSLAEMTKVIAAASDGRLNRVRLVPGGKSNKPNLK